MTENKRIDMGRFHWDSALEKIIDYETCESYYDDECVEILNDINYQNFKFEKENRQYKQKVKQVLLYHYKELTKLSEEHIDCPCSAQSRARLITIMEELGVDME